MLSHNGMASLKVNIQGYRLDNVHVPEDPNFHEHCSENFSVTTSDFSFQIVFRPNRYFFFYWRYNPFWVCILHPSSGAIASSRTRFLDHTQRRSTVGRTPLDELSVRRRDLYLTTHSTHNRQTSMPPVGFEPTIAACERP